MSNNYASSEISALFPYNQTIVTPWGADQGFSLKSDLIALDPRQKKVQGVILETKVDKNILPPMQVTIVLKILFLSIKLKVENIHVVHIDRELDGKSDTQKIFSTSARFFLEQAKYDYVNAGRQMDVSPRHSLNIKIDKDGKVKVENLFRKVVVGIFIKISGIGYLREINSSITFWKAERSYAREVKKFSKNSKENEVLKLSTPAWLYLMNICMKTALFMDNEKFLNISETNIQRIFATKMKEQFFGKIVTTDAPVVKIESKPKLILVDGSKYKYYYLPKDISIEELKIIEKYVYEKMTPIVMKGISKYYNGKTFFVKPGAISVSSDTKVNFPNGISFEVILDYTEYQLYHSDPVGYLNYKIVENYFRLLSEKEAEIKAKKQADYEYYEKRRAAEWEIKNTMKPVKGLLPWEKWEKNGKKKTGNKIVDEDLYQKYVDAKVREIEAKQQTWTMGNSRTEQNQSNQSDLQLDINNPKSKMFGLEKLGRQKPIRTDFGYVDYKPEPYPLQSVFDFFNKDVVEKKGRGHLPMKYEHGDSGLDRAYKDEYNKNLADQQRWNGTGPTEFKLPKFEPINLKNDALDRQLKIANDSYEKLKRDYPDMKL